MGLRKPRDAGGTKQGGAGIPRALYERVRTQRSLDVVSLEHEEYQGRTVLSITARDEYDGLEEVTYYEQPIFQRGRLPSTQESA